MPAAPHVLPLTRPEARDHELVGGKAARLGELVQEGYRAPPGFVVSTAAWRATLEAAGQDEEHRRRCQGLVDLEGDALEECARELRESVYRLPFPPEVQGALERAYGELGDDPLVAARSSATAEDLPEASFAGQHDSFLGIRGVEAVADAVRRVWASLFHPRAIVYRQRLGLPHEAVAPAVLVQRLVDAEASGVLFTVDPVTGVSDRMIVEACLGLGEGLVSGQAHPDHFELRAREFEVLERRLAEKASATRPDSESGELRQVEVPSDQRAEPALGDEQLRSLWQLGIELREDGKEHDVEWCFAGGELLVLQDRAVTVSLPDLPAKQHRISTVYLWSGSNFAEVVPDPPTPLGYSLVQDLLEVKFRPRRARVPMPEGYRPVEEIRGRPYWNLTPLLHRSWWSDWILDHWLGVVDSRSAALVRRLREDPEIEARWPISWAAAAWFLVSYVLLLPLRALPMIWRMLWPARAVQRVERQLARTRERLGPLAPDADVATRLERITWLRHEWRKGPLGWELHFTFLACMTWISMLVTMASRWLETDSPQSLGYRLARGISHTRTQKMSEEMWDLAQATNEEDAVRQAFDVLEPEDILEHLSGDLHGTRFREGFGDFVESYGHRGRDEEDLGEPRWREDPGELLRTIQGYRRLGDASASPRAQLRASRRRWVALVRQCEEDLRSIGGLRGWLRAALLRDAVRRASALFAFREDVKHYYFQAFDWLRQEVRELGAELVRQGRLERVEDAFYSSFDELVEWAAGRGPSDEKARKLVVGRRMARALDRGLPTPLFLRSDGKAAELPPELEEEGDDAAGEVLRGEPAAAGSAEGRVMIVEDPSDVDDIPPGTILVVHAADPSWTPLFLAADGLIMEVGGAVSHAVIVAREYGLPAVVGVRGATQRLEDGDRIYLDGGRGRVELRDVASAS